MSIHAEMFSIVSPESVVHLTTLESREARLEKIKACSELAGVEERMGQLIMEQLYWQNRFNTAEVALAIEAKLVAYEAVAARTAKELGKIATDRLSTEVLADNSTERTLKLVS